MRLSRLQIKNFRNLETIELTPAPGVNLIVGKNASGKTSLLEAIYYLSHLRSFRTQTITDLIQRQHPYLQLFAEIVSDDYNKIPLGIRRSRTKSEIRFNQSPVKRVSDIAAQFPVLAIHPDSYQLIIGGATKRRQYMDWGVFHVEHNFFKAWQRYKKALQQRNASLKSKQKLDVCRLWDHELNRTAQYIDQLRQSYFEQIDPYIERLTSLFFPGEQVTIEYRRGWTSDESLDQCLQKALQKDRLKGYTSYGPHRAEIIIKVNTQSAQTCISRGQQKTLVALMRLAQARHFNDVTGRNCVLLYDDLSAELDSNHRSLILSELAVMNIQLFLTTIEEQQVDLSDWNDKRMFHVEHGVIREEK